MAESLKKKFFTGLAWTLIENVAVRALGIIITVVLARLLTPEDYGLIGMLSIFIAVSDVFIQSGFGQALIQKSDCTDEDFSTAFYFNVAVSLLIYVAIFWSTINCCFLSRTPTYINYQSIIFKLCFRII